ncbi:hypothetical protein ACHWQZ_G018185 [Mnemiopsis leidyi]
MNDNPSVTLLSRYHTFLLVTSFNLRTKIADQFTADDNKSARGAENPSIVDIRQQSRRIALFWNLIRLTFGIIANKLMQE